MMIDVSNYIKDDNKLLIKLLLGTSFLFSILMIFIGILFFSTNISFNRALFTFIYNLTIIFFIVIILMLTLVLFSTPRYKIKSKYIKWIKTSLKILYPLIYSTGLLLNIDKDKIQGEFAFINNHIVSKENISVKPEDILILLPHCIQWSECPHKITNNINNCKMCGKCKVKDLIELSTKYSVEVSIVSGGTAARNVIKRIKPKAIVAVACERDLISGINDVSLIPILGIINERPEGPCYNTEVNIFKVEEAINYFINGGKYNVL